MANKSIRAIISATDRASPTFKKISGTVKALGVLAAGATAIAIGRKLASAIEVATEKAGIQEEAEKKLAQALRNTGQAVDKVLPALKAQAAAMQQVTRFGDEAILENQALLVSLGRLTGEGLERATKAALDLAVGTGRDLRTSFELVGKAAAGEFGTLSRYGIILDDNIKESDKFAAALSKIEEMFGGQAAAAADTYAGRLEQLSNAWGDLQETIGGPFRDVIREFAATLTEVVHGLTAGISGSDDFRNAVINLGIAVATVGQIIETTIAGPLLKFVRLVAIVGIAKLNKELAEAQAVLKLFGLEAGEGESKFAALIKRLEELKAEAADIVNPDEVGDSVTVIAHDVLTIGEASRKVAEMGRAAFQAWMDDSGARIESLGETIKFNLRDVAVSAAGELSSALIETFNGASFKFKDFMKQVLLGFAKMILQAIILQFILATIGGQGFGGFFKGVGGLLTGGGGGGGGGGSKAGIDPSKFGTLALSKSTLRTAQPLQVTFNITAASLSPRDAIRQLQDTPEAVAAGFLTALRRGAL